jgi:hypothetical protein
MLGACLVFAFSLAFLLLIFRALFVSVRMSMGMNFIRLSASAVFAHINPPVMCRTFYSIGLLEKRIIAFLPCQFYGWKGYSNAVNRMFNSNPKRCLSF